MKSPFLGAIGLSTAPHAAVNNADDLLDALTRLGTPAILKTRRLGYDGKGQRRINGQDDARAAWAELGPQGPLICEGFVDFSMELSVIAARGLGGEVARVRSGAQPASGRHSGRDPCAGRHSRQHTDRCRF